MLSIKKQPLFAKIHYKKVRQPIKDAITAIINANGAQIDNSWVPLSPDDEGFIAQFLDNQTLNEIISCEPEELRGLVYLFRGTSPRSTEKTSRLYKILYRIFVDHGYEKISKRTFVENHSLDTCPYCNRSYIYSLDDEGKVKPEIDHFFPKGIYPLFAASYYNLIPICETCNGNGAKGETDSLTQKLISPYLVNSNDFEFDFALNHLSPANPLSGKSSVEVILKKKINSNNKVLKLDKLYAKHSDHVLELIVKSRGKYSHHYREYLINFKGLGLSEAEIDRLIIGNYVSPEEQHKRPLSKLYRDIAIKLGLISE